MCNKIINNEINCLLSSFKKSKNNNSLVKDLTHLKTYTIDDSPTVEIDDAISIEKISSMYKIWIHIASPSSFIKYQSAIDRKARKQISSVYLCTETFYMLPESLIDNVFSLSDKEERESLSVGVTFNDDGSIYSSEIVKSIIKVNYRLNYTEADELIDYAPKEEEDLNIIFNILNYRKCWRKNLGAVEILESYGKIFVKDEIPRIKIIDPTLSRQLISEAMILYGDIISDFTKINKIPVPYRVQEFTGKVSTDINKNIDNKVLFNFLLKKSMGKTYYSINPMAHRSLGLLSYIHATSPIRRYADLLVHYQLNRYLNNEILIGKDEIIEIINDINNLGRQNVLRYREDQKLWLNKWFENNSFKEYQVILLNWINKYKKICILYFVEYHFSTICNMNSKIDVNVGDDFYVMNNTYNYNEMIHFQLIS